MNLAKIVLDLLKQYQIEERVISITTDNASNNSTLISSLNDSLFTSSSLSSIALIRIPCMAHIIQLCLKQLLSEIKANPINERAENIWSEEYLRGIQRKTSNINIANTLNKVCFFSLSLSLSLLLLLTSDFI